MSALAGDGPGDRAGGKTRAAAVEGWFTLDESAPSLLGSRCATCGNYAFPAASTFCANPRCDGTDFERVPLSRRGTVWSYTDARYQPPPPYVAADPYQPFAIAAVELAAERLVVMGQVVPGVGVDELAVGREVELVLDPLYEDDDHVYVVWKWKPTPASASGEPRG